MLSVAGIRHFVSGYYAEFITAHSVAQAIFPIGFLMMSLTVERHISLGFMAIRIVYAFKVIHIKIIILAFYCKSLILVSVAFTIQKFGK